MAEMDVLEVRRKKALFRAQRRGFRELDLMFGAFADARLATLEGEGLEHFEALLSVPDWQMFDWLMGHLPVPPQFDTEIFAALRDYKPNPGSPNRES